MRKKKKEVVRSKLSRQLLNEEMYRSPPPTFDSMAPEGVGVGIGGVALNDGRRGVGKEVVIRDCKRRIPHELGAKNKNKNKK